MAGQADFLKKLERLVELAKSQDCRITTEEVDAFFAEDALTTEHKDLLFSYLMSKKISVVGFVGEGFQAETAKAEQAVNLNEQEKAYIKSYLEDIRYTSDGNPDGAQLLYYLPKVVDEAVKLHHEEVFIGDMIQEGSLSLMMALQDPENDEKAILECVRAGMRSLVESQNEMKQQDRKMVERVSELDKTIQEMKELYGRKVTIEEVAQQLGVSEEEVEDILKLAGEDAEDRKENEI